MGFYSNNIEPALVSLACQTGAVSKQREIICPRAHGTVLEVGFGSGLNLPHYDASRVEHLYGLEPSPGMRKRAAKRMAASPISVELLDLSGEAIALEGQSVDSILITYTMCTIPDVAAALGEMRRVLRDGGEIFFSEHGRAPDEGVARWQNRLNGMWGKLAGGCNLNRDIPALMRNAGLQFDSLDEGYLRGVPKFAGYNYWGTARLA